MSGRNSPPGGESRQIPRRRSGNLAYVKFNKSGISAVFNFPPFAFNELSAANSEKQPPVPDCLIIIKREMLPGDY